MKGKRGLTLVELLIVIAVIAVLAGLLFPVFVTVRERARIAYCINSLKQVSGALHMYAQDYDGYVPPYTNDINCGLDSPDDHCFPNANNPSLFEAAFVPYTRDKQIWYCPLDPFAGLDTQEGAPWNTGLTIFHWNFTNHKATSYQIHTHNAMKALAPIRIDNPPTVAEYRLRTGSNLVGEPDEPLNYATDFTHSNRKRWIFLHLSYDGSVKVKVE